jgi:hypothetical protein
LKLDCRSSALLNFSPLVIAFSFFLFDKIALFQFTEVREFILDNFARFSAWVQRLPIASLCVQFAFLLTPA